jgi:hypothetical protein
MHQVGKKGERKTEAVKHPRCRIVDVLVLFVVLFLWVFFRFVWQRSASADEPEERGQRPYVPVDTRAPTGFGVGKIDQNAEGVVDAVLS